MATKKISELTPKGATIEPTDLLEISEDAGGGAWVTKRITGQNILDAAGSNFATTNLVFTTNRTHNLNGFTATLEDARLLIKSFGNTFADVPFWVKNSSNSDILKITGDGLCRFDGNIQAINVAYMSSIRDLFFTTAGIDFGSELIYKSRGDIGSAYTAHVFTTHSFMSQVGSKLMEVKNFNTVRFSVDINGLINMPNLPTSAVGLSAGDLWNDSGTVKIV